MDIELEIEFEDEAVVLKDQEGESMLHEKLPEARQHINDIQLKVDAKFEEYEIVHPFSCKLQMEEISIDKLEGDSRFYLLQVLRNPKDGVIGLLCKWGRNTVLQDYYFIETETLEEAGNKFKEKFSEKTYNEWDNREIFTPIAGGYTMIGVAPANPVEVQDHSVSFDARRLEEKFETIDKRMYTESSNLPYELSDLLRSLFNIPRAKAILTEISVDHNRLGLSSLTSMAITSAYNILNQLQREILSKSVRKRILFDLSIQFNKTIPSTKRSDIIDSIIKLRERFLTLQVLSTLAKFVDLLRSIDPIQCREVSPVDIIAQKMSCVLTPLAQSSEMGEFIREKLLTSIAPTHMPLTVQAISLFSVSPSEEFFPCRKMISRYLFALLPSSISPLSCLLEGATTLKTPSPSAGQLFGNGLYFTDTVSKALRCMMGRESDNILLIYRVATGKEFTSSKVKVFNRAPPGYDSISAQGAWRWKEKQFNGVIYADSVQEGEQNPEPCRGMRNSEWIVYDQAQVSLEWVARVEVRNK